MKWISVSALLAVALTAAAATCTHGVAQHGDAGPWTGEVTNSGDQAVYAASARAQLYEATGAELYPGRLGVLACPSKLLPGETGAFEFFAEHPDYASPFVPIDDAKLPLRADFDAVAHSNIGTGQARGDGMLVSEIARDDDPPMVRVRVLNTTDVLIGQFNVCGVARTPDGAVTSVGRADAPALPYHLFPGESLDLEMKFTTLPNDATIRYHVLGLLDAQYEECCPLGSTTWRSHDLGEFTILLPPDWKYEPAQGIDSFVGSFGGDGAVLSFDYGAYSDSLPFDDDPAYDVHFETIGGLTAKIVEAQTDVGTTGVYFSDVKRVPGATDTYEWTIRMQLSGQNLTPDQQATAIQVFRSLRFDD